MYGQHPFADAKRIIHAILTDQIAHFAPRLYIRLTGQTGRGASQESAQQIADYFRNCFDEYFQMLGIEPGQIDRYLAGKRILEYGPGNVPCVALLMIAHGADSVVCVDRFPMVSISPINAEVLCHLMEGLDGEAKQRAASCFLRQGDPDSGLREQRIRYLVQPSGLSGLSKAANLVISRAVLEHVNDLHATFADMHNALCDTGIAIHQVDLKSHGLHRSNPLDFLTWPTHWWSWMYGHKGMPNRWRVNRYREALLENGLRTILLKPTVLADQHDIEEVRPYLAAPTHTISDEDLSWLGFWLVCDKTTQQQGE